MHYWIVHADPFPNTCQLIQFSLYPSNNRYSTVHERGHFPRQCLSSMLRQLTQGSMCGVQATSQLVSGGLR